MSIEVNKIAKSINKQYSTISYPKEFSIITLVNNRSLYQEMLNSFLSAGFSTNFCEFIYLNNLESNQWDAYEGLNHGLNISNGEFAILCHQDVRLEYDKINNLREKIFDLNTIDPNWGVLGNAGGANNLRDVFIRISDPNMDNVSRGPLPSRVECLDENFILLKSKYQLRFSNDIKGFHFYGTDICQQARFRGINSYVIDFHLRHLSSGDSGISYKQSLKKFIASYTQKLTPRYIRETTNTRLYLSGEKWKSKLYNIPRILFFLRKTNLYKIFK